MNPHREEDSARFIAIFRQVSGMKRPDNFPIETQSPPRNARIGGVVGAVVVGSSTNPYAQPKDLDVIFALTQPPNPRAQEWATDTAQGFDHEFFRETGVFSQGRLDVLGFIEVGKIETLDSNIVRAISEPASPQVFAFNQEGFDRITEFLQTLRK